jgi:hypothetical protein
MQSNYELLFAKSQDVLCIVRHDIADGERLRMCHRSRDIERNALECPCISPDVQTRFIQSGLISGSALVPSLCSSTGKSQRSTELNNHAFTNEPRVHETVPLKSYPWNNHTLEPETTVEVSSGDFLLIKSISQQDQASSSPACCSEETQTLEATCRESSTKFISSTGSSRLVGGHETSWSSSRSKRWSR